MDNSALGKETKFQITIMLGGSEGVLVQIIQDGNVIEPDDFSFMMEWGLSSVTIAKNKEE